MKKSSALSPAGCLLAELVSIPSVNPEGHPGTTQTGEEKIARFVGAWLKKIGARVSYDEIEPGRPNILATFPSAKPKGRLLFAPHTDTVSVAGMTVSPFGAELKNGRLYGRGACDTKGTMAAILTALVEWRKESGKESPLEISFAGLMGEEAGNQGAIALAKKSKPFDLVIVGEPTGMKMVHAHKGAFWVTVTAAGKAVHASAPDLGRNAILLMSSFIQKAQPEMEKLLARHRHPLLGTPTVSIGVIQGGSKTNIVPASCRLEIDFRLVPNLAPKTVLSALQKIAASVSPHLKVSALRAAPAMDTDKNHPWIQAIAPATRGFDTAPWFCDAAIFSQKGMAAIACGPGSIRQAHTADEFILLKDLDHGVKAYLNIIRRLEKFLRQ